MAEEVVREILWTDSAQKSFKKIVDYLEKNWTESAEEKANCRLAFLGF